MSEYDKSFVVICDCCGEILLGIKNGNVKSNRVGVSIEKFDIVESGCSAEFRFDIKKYGWTDSLMTGTTLCPNCSEEVKKYFKEMFMRYH